MKVYLTWHLPSHGIGYTKGILSAFFQRGKAPSESALSFPRLNQMQMEATFSERATGFLFDKVYYLHPSQKVQNKIKSHRPERKWNFLEEDDEIRKSNAFEAWQACKQAGISGLEQELNFFKEEYGEGALFDEIRSQYWRNIHYYDISDQIAWFRQMSNAKEHYGANRFLPINMSEKHGLKDMRDYKNISEAVYPFLSELSQKHLDDHILVNVGLGSYETQVVWFVSAEAGLFPTKTRFISSYDLKDDPHHQRFKDFRVREAPVQLIKELRSQIDIFPATKSPSRKLAQLKLKSYLLSGFAILILGPRGTGKTQMVRENAEVQKNKIVTANCASFPEDSIAEAELFGYTKGAFTDAKKEHSGLFMEANGGILFLDEIHHLSKRVQAKLMTALQTKSDNKFEIRKLGSTKVEKVECRVVMATNRTIEDLKSILLPDFFDRIAQHIIEIPPLAQTEKDRESDWKAVWKQMFFEPEEAAPKEPELLNWLRSLKLPGNFRDLQKIAIYYKAYTEFDEETKSMIPTKSPYQFAKEEYEKYHLTGKKTTRLEFSIHRTANEMITEFKQQLAEWAVEIYGDKTKAARGLSAKKDTISRQTIHNWLKPK